MARIFSNIFNQFNGNFYLLLIQNLDGQRTLFSLGQRVIIVMKRTVLAVLLPKANSTDDTGGLSDS